MENVRGFGQLSKQDIINELDQDQGLKIYTLCEVKEKISYASYDITPTFLALSVKTGMLETVYRKRTQYTVEHYIIVKPKDTVLMVSNEFIRMPNNISGYINSRVSNVVLGFGHISTTIDPNWNGALIIALSNPSNHSLKIPVGFCYHLKGDEIVFHEENSALATVSFHYLNSPCAVKPLSYKNIRIDLLKKRVYKNRKEMAVFFAKLFYLRRKKYTDYFFEYISANEQRMETEDGWKDFLKEFSIGNQTTESKSKSISTMKNFIVKEKSITQFITYLKDRQKTIGIIFIIIFCALAFFNIIPKEIFDFIRGLI